jgi:gluconate 2-dehydrogenase gamma chain
VTILKHSCCASALRRARCRDRMKINRREWILGSLSAVAWPAIVSAQQHAHEAAKAGDEAKLEYFDPATARDVSEIAALIVPSTDGPGAAEAGAVYFIDRALKTFAADKQIAYREGLAELDRARKKLFPRSSSFAALAKEQQLQLLRSIEKTDFFDLARTHTVLAWLGSPEYGGNRNGVGWKYIGFDDAGSFDPPFGYYDTEAK